MKCNSLVFVLVIFLFLGLCEKNPSEPQNGKESEVILEPGEWTATADFGGFDFFVNENSDYITQIKYNFSSWQCGGRTMSGSITVSSDPGWEITDLQFSIEMDLDPDPFKKEPITIEGTFETSNTAAGTWEATVNNTTCSGDWEGQPKN